MAMAYPLFNDHIVDILNFKLDSTQFIVDAIKSLQQDLCIILFKSILNEAKHGNDAGNMTKAYQHKAWNYLRENEPLRDTHSMQF